MLSNESLHPPTFSRSNSQASVDSTSMEDFWCEVESIKENSEGGQEEQTVTEVKPADEGELEAEWLQDVGLSTLISGAEEEDGQALLSTLTRTQAAAVQKRYNTYTQTMRKKNKHSVRDVRDIFGVAESPPPFEPVPVSLVPANGVQVPGKKPVWKAVNSNSCLDCGLDKDTPSVAEELSFEVSFSESITEIPKEKEGLKSQRFKKEDSSLTKFIVRKSRFGLTEVGDLSVEDMKKIRYLSLIELTAFYDALGIELKRNRTDKVKGRENGLFGVPLTVLLENDQKKFPGIKVPLIFQKLLQKLEETGLETEGILRVPGSASRVKNLRQELESKFYEDTFDWDQVRNNDAAGLLKMFIRDLPSPLFTVEYLPAFIALVERISKIKLQLQALHLLIMLLPDANRDTAKAFLIFLKKVVANEGKNKMSLWNVSMIVAPNLFIYKGKRSNQEEMQAAATTAHIVRLLIRYQDILWTVPSFLITQVRKMNEAAINNTKKQPIFDKSMRKLLRRKTLERERPEKIEATSPRTSKTLPMSPSSRRKSDIPEGVIRVHAPLHSKVSMAIQLNGQTKAKDILARFHCENSHDSPGSLKMQNQSLYEIGGNIGQHCLDPDAYMLDVYHANPHAEWVIKPKTS
ncbi:rho GTPase-activating protein 28-like isoform X4 [Vombatus ursinus]|nr:rho GTPase-activating protein 28-like isoform X4 [Vombatus ursinus]XP_027702921.1 rho GTPase-activating protein 28-like isoform X4 [Vombatus ursinus]XP_027702922.1 rho GTPase-activating protein 28-like isoform X4 [Vombatus ursinus]XP_027733250.1 rho GTPase-activating protein 28-like isoform X4 [Vombatus ursinus]XP_027733251.1 rho GTPase-activating protein 28-like isoform X4 [Vombatus ursinus]XP_027733252.1 rho GTPase-activating protein 28-like isoform X4 [Vombatus ursinus]